MILSAKKRVTVTHESCATLLFLPDSWDKFIAELKAHFQLENTSEMSLTTKAGAKVDTLDIIRDNDELVLVGDTAASWITLNVGGTTILTSWSTLTKKKDTMLARMFDKDSNWRNKTDRNGAYLIDRSPKYFLPLLDYLRNDELVIDPTVNPIGVLLEAKFFGFVDLLPKIDEIIRSGEKKTLEPLHRDDVTRAIITTPSNYILRFRGLDLSAADLSNLDLKHVNFSYCRLVGTNLTRTDLYGANFYKADMTDSLLDDANAAGVMMEGTILDGASMKRCNFEDPKFRPSSLLGAQMKGVNLENSNLTGVNLRVVNLRGSKLKNCSLKGACLAGADLEGCDLNGAELENTNLRGANLADVNFEDITTALHMTHMT